MAGEGGAALEVAVVGVRGVADAQGLLPPRRHLQHLVHPPHLCAQQPLPAHALHLHVAQVLGLLGVLPRPLEPQRGALGREPVHDGHHLPRALQRGLVGAVRDLAVVLPQPAQGVHGEADVRVVLVAGVQGR